MYDSDFDSEEQALEQVVSLINEDVRTRLGNVFACGSASEDRALLGAALVDVLGEGVLGRGYLEGRMGGGAGASVRGRSRARRLGPLQRPPEPRSRKRSRTSRPPSSAVAGAPRSR